MADSYSGPDEAIISQESIDEAKRSFSLKRNHPNTNRLSKRMAKYKDTNDACNEYQDKPKKLIPTTLNRFLRKVINKVTSFNINTKSHCDGIVSLSNSEYDISAPSVRGDKVPGVIGLRNHGNTCFINAVLQCLSHTDILAEYFVLDQYKVDLCRRNKLNSKKYGTKGEVTEQLAVLLKAIWSCRYSPEISNQFKSVVDKYGSQYRGNNQHDAQEFLLWLLDKVHEDLNTATKKKYKTIKHNSFGRPEAVAAETLANHVRCNNSFVHALFQAQFCSSVTCPRCERQSNTFDPFLCVSVPVPHNHHALYVTVLYTSQQPRQVKLGLMLPINDEIKELRKLLSSYTGIPEQSMLITEIVDDGFQRTFSDTNKKNSWTTINNNPVNTIKETDNIYCLELPQCRDSAEEIGAYLLLCWVNVLVQENSVTRFGSPFTTPMCRETSYVDLQKLLLKEMAWTLHDDVLTGEQPVPLFKIRVADTADAHELSYLDSTVDHPLFTEPVEHALALTAITDAGPTRHLKLVLEWDPRTKRSIVADDTDQVEEHASVRQLKLTAEQGMTVTLEECFKLYTKAEILGAEDAWHCPNCNLKQEVIKQLGLWTLPDILVVHMKRFKQSSNKHHSGNARMPVKLSTLVDFPLYGFDMTPHLAAGCRGTSPPSVWSPWRRPSSKHHSLKRENNLYDLYAICNHHGQDLQSGHYTAHCRNPYDGQWYCFDDACVSPVADSMLVTSSAYILFYQRRGVSCSSSSSSSSTEHWASRLSVVKHAYSTEDIAEKQQSEFVSRGDRAYSTLQPSNKRSVNTQTNDKESIMYQMEATSYSVPGSPQMNGNYSSEEEVKKITSNVELNSSSKSHQQWLI